MIKSIARQNRVRQEIQSKIKQKIKQSWRDDRETSCKVMPRACDNT